MSELVLVAPREVHDVVYRCARIAGCDPGTADMLGRAVTFGEVHDHQAARAFLDLDGPEEIATVATALRQIAVAEARARQGGAEVELSFDPPIPDPLTTLARFESANRGAETVDLGHYEGRLSTLVLGPAAPIDTLARAHSDRQARFERTGLPVARDAFDELIVRSKGFLVAESILDELEDS